MRIQFLGAAQTVTGSCFLVETAKSRFLVDCGIDVYKRQSLDCPTLLGWLVKYAGEKGWGAFTLLSESDSGELLGSREQGVTSYLILSAGGEDDAR